MTSILPATAIATTSFMPVVYDLDRQYRPQEPLGVFELAETMRVHIGRDDKEFSRLVTHAWEVRNTIDRTVAEIENLSTPRLLDLTPEDVAAVVRDTSHDAAARTLDNVGYSGWRRASEALERQIEDELKAELPAFADRVVESLRPSFDEQAAVIQTALDAGITQETNPADLAVTGTTEQLEAFRALPRAVAGLDQIKRLRDSLTLTLPYGPRDQLGLAYVEQVARAEDLETAVTRSADEVEYAQYTTEAHGTAPIKVVTERIGGRWLHMLAAGLTLHLNTADEVESLRAMAKAA